MLTIAYSIHVSPSMSGLQPSQRPRHMPTNTNIHPTYAGYEFAILASQLSIPIQFAASANISSFRRGN